MIARSPLAKIAALLLAGGAHAALLVVLVEPEPAGIEGSGGAADARLGTAFRDLVEGGRAVPAVDADARPLTALRPDLAETLEATRPDAAPSPLPQTHEPVDPVADTRPAAPDRVLQQAPAAITATATHVRPADPALPVVADAARSAVAHRETVARATPVEPETDLVREASAAYAPRAPDSVLQAEPDLSPAPARSSRPPRRPESMARRAAPEPAPPPERVRPATAQSSTAGNAPRTATTGAATGRATAPSASSGAASAQATAGNAAASTYPGLVMRCISRAGRPRVAARGTAVVSFRINAGGRVTAVALAASSGNASLDQAAIRTISQAGPCPAPPPGAQTAFSIRVQGR